MDAVILAAGNGERLAGVMPTGLKPLLVVNGESMIVHVTRRVMEVNPGRIVYVVSPMNVSPIVDVLSYAFNTPEMRETCRFIVQPKATGPIAALNIALDLVVSDRIVVACADNIIPENMIAQMETRLSHEDNAPLIPVVDLKRTREADRFTKVYTDSGRMYFTDLPMSDKTFVGAWVGPLMFTVDVTLEEALRTGRTFAEVLDFYQRADTIESHCVDVGVPT